MMAANIAVLRNEETAAAVEWTPQDQALIQETVAKGTTPSEFKLFLYTASKYQLDPLVKQVWCVKYGNNPASIFTGRDGFLSIAHRSGQFDGMESGVRKEGDELIGWCKVYRKGMSHPFSVEVLFSEYTTGKSLWQSKPRTMIQKVAESQALRKAFDISGLYAPEEIDTEQQAPQGPRNITPAKREQPEPPKQQPQQEQADDETPLPQSLDELMSYAHNLGLGDEDVKEALFVATGHESLKGVELKRAELRAWLNEIDERGAQLVDVDAEQDESGPDDISDLAEPQAVAQ